MSRRKGVTEISFGDELGRGFFARVVAATLSPHGEVAAKVIDCTKAADRLGTESWKVLKKHLFAEAERLSDATHDNVVRVYSVHHSPSREEVYIVTERCDGTAGDLARIGPVPLKIVDSAVRQALLGLEALHVRGMIHRDLKPSNILCKGLRFKLGDFGLVTDDLIKGYASRQGYTEHLAPETFDVGVTSTSTDVWAMGMTIFRLLNGEPWHADMLASWGIDRSDPIDAAPRIEEIVTGGHLTARLRWMPHVPAAWRRFVNKALSSSTTRFHDGGAMLTGMGNLRPVPSWDCDYSERTVTWRRARGEREEIVEWARHSERRHEFRAFTRPHSGAGRSITLESSGGIVGQARVLAELQRFFQTRNE